MANVPFYMSEDLSPFFSHFAEELTLDNGVIIDCIYDENFQILTGFTNEVVGTNIAIHLKNTDLYSQNIKKNTFLSVRGINFKVKELHRDGSGISVLELEKIKE